MNVNRVVVACACFGTALITLAEAMGGSSTGWSIFLAVAAAAWVLVGVGVIKNGVE